ncbi:DUF2201 family putative metallopeptidase [Dactylosporangium matsuzakiense]|uniref:Putative metallopeptidase domain-containing protein n=1 Tax=Dactylosporangium matsuzakiense TaxID=53360 RepID=A0A9W6KFC5_9ACTN|nr:hypothetical protein [Dactylosporangium matsuzakiense]UWZ48853.1 hypothetical protein Dmats_22095 [Dactylosporangium matsuzakiense]GLL01037.1 hypothetical protein GCM10017581_027780 [Dactylosporangium matsuzakiense]
MTAGGVDLLDRRAVAALVHPDAQVQARAVRLKEAALLDFGVRDSVAGSWIYAKCRYQIATMAVPTAAVVAGGDGVCALLYNPGFFAALGPSGVKFVLFHEARHLMQRHLHADRELQADPLFRLATEVSVNHVAIRRLGMALPRVDGESVGVDPVAVHDAYRRDLAGQGLAALDYAAFVETDLGVYRELRRMAAPPALAVCLHLDGDGVPLDPETVERVGSAVLESLMRQARAGNAAARAELLELAARTGDAGERVARMWGDLGLGALRGVTQKTRRVEWWRRWLADVLAAKLRPGERLVYPKKLGAVLLALGHEPMLHRRGDERYKTVLIAFDTSASMPDPVVEWLTTLVGQVDGVRAHWLSFDAEVMPFAPGERVLGGGGTSFQGVVDYAEGRLEVAGRRLEDEVDAVIVVTDGHAPPVRPAEPGKWIWLITDGGSTWPERQEPAMACHRVRTAQE